MLNDRICAKFICSRRRERGHNEMSRKIWHSSERFSSPPPPSYPYIRVYASAIDLARYYGVLISSLENSFKTRFGTSVLPIASASIIDALVPRMDRGIYGTYQFYSCAFAKRQMQPRSTMYNDVGVYIIFEKKKKKNVISFYKRKREYKTIPTRIICTFARKINSWTRHIFRYKLLHHNFRNLIRR